MAREWISGFTGSAGTVVVTACEAGLWTDSRYFLQAAAQLEGTGIDLFKEMLPETPSIPAFLCARLTCGEVVGIDGTLFSTATVRLLQRELEGSAGLVLRSVADPFEAVWADRPPLPTAPAFVHPLHYAGRTVAQKLDLVRQATAQAGAEALLIPTLDEIAWTLNLRGSDVHCNPVVVSYLLVTPNEVHLFIQPGKVTAEVASHLNRYGVTTHDYGEVTPYLSCATAAPTTPSPACKPIRSLLLDPSKASYALTQAVGPACRVIEGASPVALLKAVRNEVEIDGLHRAMERDGVALVKFLKWLEVAVPQGGETELSIDRRLHELRAAQPLYVGESFDTIAGYGEHGAIVHYEATPATDIPLRPRGFLLLDSGAQYLDGTTDITRTIALGPLTEEEREDYTLILKGHIDLAMAVFPEGTRGAQLDVLARMPIWQRGMNYLHGTGHGVGHYLNVHEGPQSIRMNENPVTLRPGMLTSNEPGVYKAGSHGIRTENLVLCVPAAQGTNRYGLWASDAEGPVTGQPSCPPDAEGCSQSSQDCSPTPATSPQTQQGNTFLATDSQGMFGRYFAFETVTLCPICTKGIILELLTGEEIEWLNRYHRMVYDRLSPHLDSEDERSWLRNACRPISSEQ